MRDVGMSLADRDYDFVLVICSFLGRLLAGKMIIIILV